MKNKTTYFVQSILILVPIGLTSAFFNGITLDVMSSLLPGYPTIITVRTYTPDEVLRTLHHLGYQGILIITGLFVAAIGGITFFLKKTFADKLNFVVLLVGIYLAVFSLAWVCLPMIVFSKY